MSKKIIFFILLFNLTGYAGIAISEIIPLKKPIQTKEETQKKLDKALKRNLIKEEQPETKVTKSSTSSELPVEDSISEVEETIED